MCIYRHDIEEVEQETEEKRVKNKEPIQDNCKTNKMLLAALALGNQTGTLVNSFNILKDYGHC